MRNKNNSGWCDHWLIINNILKVNITMLLLLILFFYILIYLIKKNIYLFSFIYFSNN